MVPIQNFDNSKKQIQSLGHLRDNAGTCKFEHLRRFTLLHNSRSMPSRDFWIAGNSCPAPLSSGFCCGPQLPLGMPAASGERGRCGREGNTRSEPPPLSVAAAPNVPQDAQLGEEPPHALHTVLGARRRGDGKRWGKAVEDLACDLHGSGWARSKIGEPRGSIGVASSGAGHKSRAVIDSELRPGPVLQQIRRCPCPSLCRGLLSFAAANAR